MASKAPPPPSSRQPAGVPSSGGGKYVVIALILLGGIGAVVVWKMMQPPPTPPVIVIDAGAPVSTQTGHRNLDDDVPLPPPAEDGGPDAGKKVTIVQNGTASQCEVKRCSGTTSTELENALQFRVRQAHRCYDNALAQDPTLRGKITVSVRVGANGQACSANVTSNEMGSSQVASCVAGYFRGANFPSPRGGCIDANIPINFVPR